MKRCWDHVLLKQLDRKFKVSCIFLDQDQYLRNCAPTPPLPLPNINPNLLSVDCRWVKGGEGTQLLECGH